MNSKLPLIYEPPTLDESLENKKYIDKLFQLVPLRFKNKLLTKQSCSKKQNSLMIKSNSKGLDTRLKLLSEFLGIDDYNELRFEKHEIQDALILFQKKSSNSVIFDKNKRRKYCNKIGEILESNIDLEKKNIVDYFDNEKDYCLIRVFFFYFSV